MSAPRIKRLQSIRFAIMNFAAPISAWRRTAEKLRHGRVGCGSCCGAVSCIAGESETQQAWESLPAILAEIRPPTFPDRDFPITEFGAEGDGQTDCKPAFDQSDRRVPRSRRRPRRRSCGRMVRRGPIHLKSSVNLHVARRRDRLCSARARRLPAGGVHAFRRQRGDELLAADLRHRSGEHRDHGLGHVRRPGRPQELVALEDATAATTTRASCAQMAEDGVPAANTRVRRRAITSGRISCSPIAARTC